MVLRLPLTPAGVFLDGRGVVRYVHGSAAHQFDVADPRVRQNLEIPLSFGRPNTIDSNAGFKSDALAVFGAGANLFNEGKTDLAIEMWRQALEMDPDNFLIHSQIWAAEHPERLWPVVDREWQEAQLAREGYNKPLP